jgi:hypothetical protein
MHERTNIQLSAADRKELEAVVANRNSPQKHVWRAKIVLLTADDSDVPEADVGQCNRGHFLTHLGSVPAALFSIECM